MQANFLEDIENIGVILTLLFSVPQHGRMGKVKMASPAGFEPRVSPEEAGAS